MTWVFILTLKVLYVIQSFKLTKLPPENIDFYYNSTQYSELGNIRKLMSYVSSI